MWMSSSWRRDPQEMLQVALGVPSVRRPFVALMLGAVVLVVGTDVGFAQLPGTRIPGGCEVPVTQRTSDTGCYLTATLPLSLLPGVPVYWHVYWYPARAAATRPGSGPRALWSSPSARLGYLRSLMRSGGRPRATGSRGSGRCRCCRHSTTPRASWRRSFRRGKACKRPFTTTQDPRLGIWSAALSACAPRTGRTSCEKERADSWKLARRCC